MVMQRRVPAEVDAVQQGVCVHWLFLSEQKRVSLTLIDNTKVRNFRSYTIKVGGKVVFKKIY